MVTYDVPVRAADGGYDVPTVRPNAVRTSMHNAPELIRAFGLGRRVYDNS